LDAASQSAKITKVESQLLDHRQNIRRAPRDQAAYSAAPEQVLVIGNDQNVRDVIAELLTEEGFWLTSVPHHLEIEQVNQLQPNLIVLDVVYKGEEADLRFITELREHSGLATIPLLISVVATDRCQSQIESISQSSTVIISKPFDIEEFLAAVERCMASVSESN
jgi:CheY-like chemotaxis protein